MELNFSMNMVIGSKGGLVSIDLFQQPVLILLFLTQTAYSALCCGLCLHTISPGVFLSPCTDVCSLCAVVVVKNYCMEAGLCVLLSHERDSSTEKLKLSRQSVREMSRLR